MTIYHYLSNAKSKNISVRVANDKLMHAFSKGAVSYPRTDGINHKPLQVLSNNIDNTVKELITSIPDVKIKKENYFTYIEGDAFMLSYYLNLSVPGGIFNDYERFQKNKYEKEKNFLAALEYRKKEIILKKEKKIELNNFNFQNILKDIVVDELNIEDEKDISINLKGLLDF